MHGFFLFNKKKNFSPYLSWRFESKKKNFPKKIEYLRKNLFKKTGLLFRPGIPIVNFYKENLIIKNYKFFGGVAEAICFFGGYYNNKSSLSYAHSTGFYNLKGFFFNKKFFDNYISEISKTYLGFINYKRKKIKVFCGIGDLQACVLGSKLKKSDVLINMGTGSQIVTINKLYCKKNIEKRPLNKQTILYCKTHIPSGKAILFFCKQISYHKKKSNQYFWRTLASIKLSDLRNVDADIDFFQLFKQKKFRKNFFKKNYKYLCYKLIKSYLNQYVNTLENSFKLNKMKSITLSGGIPKKIPVIKKYFLKETSLKVYLIKKKIDETLLGLQSIF